MTWTEDDKATVKAMLERGDRPSAIGPIFHVSRNAIIGLMHRNGWESPHKQRPREGTTQPKLEKRERSRSTRMRIAGPNMMRAVEVIETEAVSSTADFDAAIPLEQRKTFAQLTEKTCRWPVGDVGSPGFFFCGAVALEDHSYCSFHCRAAYQPPRDRSGGLFTLLKWKTQTGPNL